MSRSNESWHEAHQLARQVRRKLNDALDMVTYKYDPYWDTEDRLITEIRDITDTAISKANELIGFTSPDWLIGEDKNILARDEDS